MLLPQQNLNYIDTLLSLFKNSRSSAQKSIITTLWFAYTCKGDSFLQSVIADKSLDKEVVAYAKSLMKKIKIGKEEEDFIKSMNKEELDSLRKQSLRRFSDEAIDELELTTRVLRKENHCQ